MVALGGLALILFMHQTSLDTMSTLPSNLGDPSLSTWILSWEWHAITSEPARFFQGNMFHPFGDAIKYSELMLPLVPVFGPISTLSGDPILGINLTMLGLSLLSFIATYMLARRFTGSCAAVLAAVSFTFSGYVFMHQSHLQLLTLGFFPLGFLALFRVLEYRRMRDGVWLGVCSALLTTGSFYYGAIWFVCIGVVLIADAIRLRIPGRDWWVSVGASVAVSVLFLGPIAYVFFQFQAEVPFVRDTAGYGLRPLDFLTPAPGSLIYSELLDWTAANRTGGAVEHGFFLGLVTPALTAIGGVSLLAESWSRRPRGQLQDYRRREMWWMVLAGIVALSVAVGPSLFGVPLPLHFLRTFVPGFDAMRAISRLAVPGLLTASLLAALSLDRLIRGRSADSRLILAAVVISVVMLEMYVEPITVEISDPPEVIIVLSEAAGGAVVELPMRETFDAQFALMEGPRLLASVGDWRPRFNGYSGGVPPGYMEYVTILNQFPAPGALAALDDLGIRYVVLHGGDERTEATYSRSDIDGILAALPVGASFDRYGDDWLIDLEVSVGPPG